MPVGPLVDTHLSRDYVAGVCPNRQVYLTGTFSFDCASESQLSSFHVDRPQQVDQRPRLFRRGEALEGTSSHTPGTLARSALVCRQRASPVCIESNMVPQRLPKFSSLRFRRLVTAVAIVAYFGNVWGFPLPVAESKDVSVAFPCQNHACGCQSAAQCWQDCCCYTPAQRLAWADAHGVSIPEKVRAELVVATQEQPATRQSRRSCCQHEGDATSCASAEGGCSHCKSNDCKSNDCKSNDRPRARGWVLGIEARKCRGLSTEWVVSGASLPLEIQTLWEFDWTPVGRRTVAATDACRSIATSPAVPPPQV